eukprot:10298616-Alexandrium_andersonii.AAC.1
MGCWLAAIGCVGDTPPNPKGLSSACESHGAGREASPPRPADPPPPPPAHRWVRRDWGLRWPVPPLCG